MEYADRHYVIPQKKQDVYQRRCSVDPLDHPPDRTVHTATGKGCMRFVPMLWLRQEGGIGVSLETHISRLSSDVRKGAPSPAETMSPSGLVKDVLGNPHGIGGSGPAGIKRQMGNNRTDFFPGHAISQSAT